MCHFIYMRLPFDDSAFETWTEEREYTPTAYKDSTKFFRSKAWMIMRRRVLRHYGRKCMKCGEINGPIQVDHIKPRFYFPELSLCFDNLQVLCKGCNDDKGTKTIDYRENNPCLVGSYRSR